MNELEYIMKKFVESGWDLIAIPAQKWLIDKSNKEELIASIKQANSECRNCGCELDILYVKALKLLHEN